MSDPSAQEILTLLDMERRALLERVDGVPVALRRVAPPDGGWSVVDVLEHLARVEKGIARLLDVRGRERPAEPASRRERALTESWIARVRDRAEPMEAPERIRPTGELTYEQAVERLAETRAALRAALLGADELALDNTTHPHPFIGDLTLHEWAEFVAHHEARHGEQISRIATALDAAGVAVERSA